jgi:hypothetical protein
MMNDAKPPVFRQRRADSARFSTYYKVQWYDTRNCAWHDIQKQHATREAALAAYPAGKRCRTMEVTPSGRGALPGTEIVTANK